MAIVDLLMENSFIFNCCANLTRSVIAWQMGCGNFQAALTQMKLLQMKMVHKWVQLCERLMEKFFYLGGFEGEGK